MVGNLPKTTERQSSPWFRQNPLMPWREDLEDLFSRFWGEEREGWLTRGLATTLDVSETDNSVEIEIDLPGIKPEDIDIQLSGNVLTIRGERREEETEEDARRKFHRVERRYGSFSRSVTLPCSVQEDECAANFKDGVLKIILPKCEEAKSKKIEVKS